MQDLIILDDCRNTLKTIPTGSVRRCVTSPPYYKLRDYGFITQIGLEPTPEAFIQELVQVFREIWRILAKDGTLWIVIGDSYAARQKKRTAEQAARKSNLAGSKGTQISCSHQPNKVTKGLKAKDLIGIPWMLAFALRADGWYLRQDIIWSKPNPMPESVTDRCTKAHEYVFLLSKSPKYYYNAQAIEVPVAPRVADELKRYGNNEAGARKSRGYPSGPAQQHPAQVKSRSGNRRRKSGSERDCPPGSGSNVCSSVPWEGATANKRSVWTITTKPSKDHHFAGCPPELVQNCILAGSQEGDIILDPFAGKGTTGIVAKHLNRHYLLIDGNPNYIKIAKRNFRKEFGLFDTNQ